MPIKIYEASNPDNEIAWLANDEWEMPAQISALRNWLANEANKLSSEKHIADLGYSPRKNAAGGGEVIDIEMMESMVRLRIELHLSEYPSS